MCGTVFSSFFVHCVAESGVLVDAGQPEGHVLAGGGHHHVLGVELDAADGLLVVAVQHAHLRAVLGVPDVDPGMERGRSSQ